MNPTKIRADILKDSITKKGHRITTFKLTFPRFILAELNTHRLFSKNSASSRAIPFKKMVESVENDPFIPIAWQKSHTGMQGSEYFTEELVKDIKGNPWHYEGDWTIKHQLEQEWLQARDFSIEQAKLLDSLGSTKQLCNRLLEPFMWHTVILTATEFDNFFKLRCPQYTDAHGHISKSRKDYILNTDEKDMIPVSDLGWRGIDKTQAEIHIAALAEEMWDALNENKPVHLNSGEWHIPLIDDIDYVTLGELTSSYYAENRKEVVDVNKWLVKISSARCARISYTTVGEDLDRFNYRKDLNLHDLLFREGHMSPFEHCARVMEDSEYNSFVKGWNRNFRGFIQYRSLLEDNTI